MADRGERRLLWFFGFLVGAGFCVFALSNAAIPVRLLFLPVGLAIAAYAAFRLRRLGRRRRSPDAE